MDEQASESGKTSDFPPKTAVRRVFSITLQVILVLILLLLIGVMWLPWWVTRR